MSHVGLSIERVRTKHARGEELAPTDVLRAMIELYSANPVTKVPILGILSLNGRPYSLVDHFPFEPVFKIIRPSRMVLKCARQVSKSTSISADGVLSAASAPVDDPLRILYVTPRFEQIRRLSVNDVRPFINHSMIKPLLIDESCVQQVLQRSFSNGSSLFFSFAFLDCDRIRGISGISRVNYDEVQHLDYDFIPIIHQTMATKHGMSIYSGTPLTRDNGLEALWQQSSKAEWVMLCDGCGRWNMATIHEQLLKMIGLKGIVCAYCDAPINPRRGHWYHTDKDKVDFHGYHVPQVIMPMHYGDPKKWIELLGARDGSLPGWSQQKFYNEVLGESADFGVKLVTSEDIIKASKKLGPNDWRKSIDKFRQCKVRVLAVDWGGGGIDEISYTTAALVGLNAFTGQIECHYCVRFHAGYNHDAEAKELLVLFREGACHWFAHDFGGAGSVRETLMIQSGLPLKKIMGFQYVKASTHRNIVVYNPPAQGEIRGYHSLDKTRSLVLQAVCVKSGVIQLPEYESSKNVTSDLLALMEDKHELPGGSDAYLIRRQPKMSDDFAHSLNYGSIAIWHSEQRYPDLSAIQGIKLTAAQLEIAAPQNPRWNG